MTANIMTDHVVHTSYSIEEIIKKPTCPYCGKSGCKRTCQQAEDSKILQDTIRDYRYASHKILGRVMILQTYDGLALVEGESPGRNVVPLNSLVLGVTEFIMSKLDEYPLQEDEILTLINTLRLRINDIGTKTAKYPSIPIGAIVEIRIGDEDRTFTIIKRVGEYQYLAEGHNTKVNVSPKQILRVLSY